MLPRIAPLALCAAILPAAVAGAQRSSDPVPPLAVSGDSAQAIVAARRLARGIMTRSLTQRRPDGSTVTLPNHIPGMSIAVVRHGRLLWTEGFGLSDIERGIAAGAETRYRIGSVSKVLTAALLARLIEEGKIALDEPVQRYVPRFPSKRQAITVRQLAGHLSGIRHYRFPGDPVGQRAFRSLEEGLDIFSADSLNFEPGTRYGYTSYGYNLLGVALEGAGGEPFTAAMRRLVLHPLSLWSVTPDYRDSIVVNRATPYDYGRDQRVINAPWDDVSYKWPSGGYVASVGDLALFGASLIEPGFLRRETLAQLFTPQRLRSGESTGVGLGWRIGADSTGRAIHHHAGAATGGRAVLVIFPGEGMVVAMAANIQAVFNEHDAARVARLFGGW